MSNPDFDIKPILGPYLKIEVSKAKPEDRPYALESAYALEEIL